MSSVIRSFLERLYPYRRRNEWGSAGQAYQSARVSRALSFSIQVPTVQRVRPYPHMPELDSRLVWSLDIS